MSFIEVLMLLFTIWAVYVTVAEFRYTAKRKVVAVPSRKPMKAADIPWGQTRGYQFDDAPAEPVIPKIDPNNIFEQYDAKVAAANPADPTPPPFSVN